MKKIGYIKLSRLFWFGIILLMPFIGIQAKKNSKARIVKVNGNDMVVCPVGEISDTVDIPLSSLVESLQVVKLENSVNALIENAWFTDVSKKYICIKTHGRFPAKLFDLEGKYLGDLGKIGRGPGEYNQLYGIQIDDKKDLIYLTPFGTTRKILVYGADGVHRKDIPLACTQRKFKAFVSEETVTVLSMPFKGDSAICFQQTTDGRLLKSISPKPYMLSESFDGEVFVNHCTSDYDLFNTSIDTLYHFDTVKNRLTARFTCEFGSEKKPVHIYRETPKHYISLYRHENGKWYEVLVDKKTLESRYFRITNDLFGGLRVSPVYWNGYLILNYPAISLKNQIKNALKNNKMTDEVRRKLTDFDKNLQIDDNNIIFFGKLKQ
jgi:hypothetical protein